MRRYDPLPAEKPNLNISTRIYRYSRLEKRIPERYGDQVIPSFPAGDEERILQLKTKPLLAMAIPTALAAMLAGSSIQAKTTAFDESALTPFAVNVRKNTNTNDKEDTDPADSDTGTDDPIQEEIAKADRKVLDLSGKNLSSIDLSEYTKLQYLNVANNQLKHLDLTKCTNLLAVNCSNNQLEKLDLSKNSKLKALDCSGNRLPFLSLSGPVIFGKPESCTVRDEQGKEYTITTNFSNQKITMPSNMKYLTLQETFKGLLPGNIDASRFVLNGAKYNYETGLLSNINGGSVTYYYQSTKDLNLKKHFDLEVTLNFNGPADPSLEVLPPADQPLKPFEPGAGLLPDGTVKALNMYRLYNPNSGEHFYTADAHEHSVLVSLGWQDEGTGWLAPERSSTPVYRLYNPNAGDHHYTMSQNECDVLRTIGWNYEGIGWYSDEQKGVALYRQYNPNAVSGAHNYTVDRNENDTLVSLGWKAEGISWYGLAENYNQVKPEEIQPE